MPNLEPNAEPPRRVTPLEVPAMQAGSALRFPLTREQLSARVREALDEDGAFNDVTTIATVRSDRRARASVVRDRGHAGRRPLVLGDLPGPGPESLHARGRRGRPPADARRDGGVHHRPCPCHARRSGWR